MLLHAVEDLRGQPLDEVDLGAHALVGDLVVELADLGDGGLALVDDRLQLRRELVRLRLRLRLGFGGLGLRRGGGRFFRRVGLFAAQHDAQDAIYDRRHDGARHDAPEGIELPGV